MTHWYRIRAGEYHGTTRRGDYETIRRIDGQWFRWRGSYCRQCFIDGAYPAFRTLAEAKAA